MKISKNPRIVIAGSVNSTRVTLEKLIAHDMNVVGVLGLSPDRNENVSGYCDLKDIAQQQDLSFTYFENINNEDSVNYIKKADPDLLFVVGLSQLVKKSLLDIPSNGCIGFHPTMLPRGRGRGAIAWLILGEAEGGATFFKLDEGMDSGPILAQEPFEVESTDYAEDVVKKILNSIEVVLDKILPIIKKGELPQKLQDHSKATFLGRRRPEDGIINWEDSSKKIHTLIRAVSRPLPGAFTYYNDEKIIINKAKLIDNSSFIGVPGRILKIYDGQEVLVQTGKGQILLEDFSGIKEELKVGRSFGINYEIEINKLKSEIKYLKRKYE